MEKRCFQVTLGVKCKAI